MCVIHSVAIPFILNVRSEDLLAEVTQEEGHTGFLHLPSAVCAFIFLARRIQLFISLVDREVEFCVLKRPTLMHTKNLYENGPNPFFSGFFNFYGYENGPNSYGQIRLSFS